MKRSLLLASGFAALLAVPAFSQSTTPTSPSNPTPSPSAPAQTAPTMTTPNTGTSSGTMAPAPGSTSNTMNSGSTMTTGSATGMWYTAPIGPNQHRASDLINQSVYNRANERVGEVNELVLDQNGQVVAAIIGVGGFLGIGERNVAVNFSQLQMVNDNNTMRLVVNADKAQLQQAPEFRRPDTWRRL
jgi:sporulation protein YlmC with PRC-barrel domain